MHRYRPSGLIPSAPVSADPPPVPLVEFGSESPRAFPATELLLPGPECAVG